jgi:hypothetical protein
VFEATAQMFDPADPYRPVKAFLQEYQTLFGFGPEALDDANVQRDYVSAVNSVRDHPLPLPWAKNPGRRAGSQINTRQSGSSPSHLDCLSGFPLIGQSGRRDPHCH